MTNDEIIKAVKDIERYFGIDGNIKNLNGIKCLLSLAEEYLKVEGWPEEEEHSDDIDEHPGYVNGFNKALRLCKLAAMQEKSKVSREQIEGCLNSVFSEYALNGQGNRSLIKSLAEELLELINGEEKI